MMQILMQRREQKNVTQSRYVSGSRPSGRQLIGPLPASLPHQQAGARQRTRRGQLRFAQSRFPTKNPMSNTEHLRHLKVHTYD